jgi:hypothetical protein
VPRPFFFARSVFINCPFSPEYQPIFRAILFSVYACGFRPRCALEVSDSSENRLSKIESIIEQSKFGIHDISTMNVDPKTKLARLNMAFELGMFLGAKRFGSRRQKQKIALVFDKHRYRYRASLSDISGQDIAAHRGVANNTVREVRDWLDASRQTKGSLPGGDYISRRFYVFSRQLPAASKAQRLNAQKLTYADLCRAIEAWLEKNV